MKSQEKDYLRRGIVLVNLGSYLKELKAIEYFLPENKRLNVPTLAELIQVVGSNKNTMSRLSTGSATTVNVALAAAIIREMRHRGFPMQITDLIDYIGPDERPREVVLEELHDSDQSDKNAQNGHVV